ncbi:methylated-DNA-protein-cysteine methyltransferase-like protein [Deinococcus sp. HSC-46F16]|uniref:MGMT family protein n=1 Tax=Deinococcus sp. HSC-46F16 TaxID=2910968 RepID=UPI0020A1E211|nr:MGMT family protein [Deinococcus sp. HSC-46F16]MCP2014217.1 methylated-DNA-protein-cysteine methyltransferase-like protein [Deinococcus sp. HSC-46F16]
MPTSPDATFREQVLALVARIPPGRVMTYGQLALLAGRPGPGGARLAGFVLGSLAGQAQGGDTDLPWQRVINAQGKVSTHKLGFGDVQERLLEAEGVTFDPSGRCDLARWQWWPPEEARDAAPEPLL